jgi:hypothetical protein
MLPGREPEPPWWEVVTNRLSYGTAPTAFLNNPQINYQKTLFKIIFLVYLGR